MEAIKESRVFWSLLIQVSLHLKYQSGRCDLTWRIGFGNLLWVCAHLQGPKLQLLLRYESGWQKSSNERVNAQYSFIQEGVLQRVEVLKFRKMERGDYAFIPNDSAFNSTKRKPRKKKNSTKRNRKLWSDFSWQYKSLWIIIARRLARAMHGEILHDRHHGLSDCKLK